MNGIEWIYDFMVLWCVYIIPTIAQCEYSGGAGSQGAACSSQAGSWLQDRKIWITSQKRPYNCH